MGPSKSSIKKRKTLMWHLPLTMVYVLSQRLLIWFPDTHSSKQTVRNLGVLTHKVPLGVGHQCFCILSRDFHQSNKTHIFRPLIVIQISNRKKKGKRYNFEKQLNKKFTSAVGLYFQNVPNKDILPFSISSQFWRKTYNHSWYIMLGFQGVWQTKIHLKIYIYIMLL